VGGQTSRPGRFTPGKGPVPIVLEAGWTPWPVWTVEENLAPPGVRFPDRPARSQSLYRLGRPSCAVVSFYAPRNWRVDKWCNSLQSNIEFEWSWMIWTKANWIGRILHRNCVPKYFIEGKVEGTAERGRRPKLLLNDHKKEKNMESERGSTRSYNLETSLWK